MEETPNEAADYYIPLEDNQGHLKNRDRKSLRKPNENLRNTGDSMGRMCINWLMLVKCFEDENGYISTWYYYYYADKGYVGRSRGAKGAVGID